MVPRFLLRALTAGGTTTVVVCGELDIATAPELERALCDGETSAEMVIADLRDVGFIDSFGLHVIVAALQRIRRELELVELPPARA